MFKKLGKWLRGESISREIFGAVLNTVTAGIIDKNRSIDVVARGIYDRLTDDDRNNDSFF